MYKDYEIKLNAILDRHKGVQKVELGLIDDIDKAEDKARSYEKKLEAVLDKAIKEANVIIDLNEKVQIIAQKGLKAAKDLGSDEAIKLFNTRNSDAKANIQEMKSIRSKISSFNI